MLRQFFECVGRAVRLCYLYQLNLFKLMLTDHAPCVPAIAARFTPKARRVTDEPQWQAGWLEDFVANQIGDGDFCCWD